MIDDDPEQPAGPTPAQLLAHSREAWSRIPALREAMVQQKNQGAMLAFMAGLKEAQAVQRQLHAKLYAV